MSDATAAVGQYADEMARQRREKRDRNERTLGAATGAVSSGLQYADRNQKKAQLQKWLADNGIDPNLVNAGRDAVVQAIEVKRQEMAANARMKNALGLMNMGGSAVGGAPQDQGGAMIPWPSPAADASMTAPPSREPVMGGSVPPPDASTPGIVAPPRPAGSTVGGVPMQPSPGGFPNTDPSQFTQKALLQRMIEMNAAGKPVDAGAYATASGMIQGAYPQLTPVQQKQIERDNVGIERDRWEMGQPRTWQPTSKEDYLEVHPPPAPREPNAPSGEDQPVPDALAAELEKKYGMAPGSFKNMTPRQIGLTPSPRAEPSDAPKGPDQPLRPEVASAIEKQYQMPPGSLSGMTFREWDTMKKDPQAEILKQLQIIAAQRASATYESPELNAAQKTYDDLIEISRNRDKTNEYPGRKVKLDADIAAAKAAVDAAKAATPSGTFPPVPKTAPGPTGVPSTAPSWEEFK